MRFRLAGEGVRKNKGVVNIFQKYQGTYPKINLGPYHPLKFRDKCCSTVVAGMILVVNFRAP